MTHMSHFISDMLVIQPTLRTFCYWTFPQPMTHPLSMTSFLHYAYSFISHDVIMTHEPLFLLSVPMLMTNHLPLEPEGSQ